MHASISDISYTVAASSAYTVVFKQFKLAIQVQSVLLYSLNFWVNKPAKGNSTGFSEPSLLRTAEVQGTGGEH